MNLNSSFRQFKDFVKEKGDIFLCPICITIWAWFIELSKSELGKKIQETSEVNKVREDDASDKDDENQHEEEHMDLRKTSLGRSMHWT